MKKIKNVLFSLFLFVPIANVIAADADVKALEIYVKKLISDGEKLFNNKKISEEDREKQVAELLRKNLNLEWMAKYSLGRNRRTVSDAKLQEFTSVYSTFVINTYVELSKNYKGEDAELKSVKKLDEDLFMVSMEISNPRNSQSYKIDYLVHEYENSKDKEGRFKVSDIISEGVSVLNAQQSEFNSILSGQGIDVLIAELKTKVANKSKPSSAESSKPAASGDNKDSRY